MSTTGQAHFTPNGYTLSTCFPCASSHPHPHTSLFSNAPAYPHRRTDSYPLLAASVPADPTEVGFYDTPGDAQGVAVAGDYVHVADGKGGLVVLRLLPPLLLNKRATPRDGLRNNDALTYTLTFSGPGLNVHLWDPLPPAVRYVSGSISSIVIPPAVYSPAAHAVVWEGTLPADTAQVIRFQVTPGITGTGSLSLALPIVNTAWLTDTEYGRSVSATVIVNGWRVYLPLVMRQSP